MIKVLLVDDEELLRRGIKALVNWDKFNCTVIGEASNGILALEFIKNNEVNLVIMDIRMPVMDGLELMQEIHKYNKDIKIIVVSGYDDFEYAKTALRCGASNYVLKPVDEEEINQAVAHAKKQIEESMSMELIKNEAKSATLKRLMEGSFFDEEYDRELLRDLEVNLNELYFCVGIAVFKDEDSLQKDIALQRRILECVESFIDKNCSGEVFWSETMELCIILAYTDDYFEREIMFLELRKRLQEENGISCIIGIGLIYDSMNKISRSYEEAKEALNYYVNYKDDAVIDYERIKNHKQIGFIYPLEEEANVLKEITSGYRDTIILAVEEFFNRLLEDRYLSIDMMKHMITELIIAVKRYLATYKGQHVISYNEIFEALSKEKDIKAIQMKLNEVFIKANEQITEYKSANMNSVIEGAKEYVAKHFAERFTLDDLTQHLFVSKSYFCKIFKDETGTNFKNYLNDYRIQKAKELLKDIGYKNYEISLMVGFEDHSYFNQLFKKKVGMTPSEYRNACKNV